MKLLQPLVYSVVFLTYNWPLIVMIMMACNDNEKLCTHIMLLKQNDNETLIFDVIIMVLIMNTP